MPRLRVCVAITPVNTSLPTCVSCQIWPFEVKGHVRNYGDLPEKKLTPRVPLFKVTQGYRNRHRATRHTYYFLLVIRCNHGPLSYRFWHKQRLRSNIAKFSYSRVFNAPAEGFRWEICNNIALCIHSTLTRDKQGLKGMLATSINSYTNSNVTAEKCKQL